MQDKIVAALTASDHSLEIKMKKNILTTDQINEFNQNGVLLIPNFYDLQNIERIQFGIYQIIGLLIEKYQLPVAREAYTPETFDSGYSQLIAASRAYGGEVYDAAKQIPAFLRQVSCERNERLFAQLRGTDAVGIGAASYGIRIDNPGEEKFRSHWHQEFLFQPQSLDGIVMWTPLVKVTPEMGPVQVCVGSHKAGLQRYTKGGKYADKQGAYQIGLPDEDAAIKPYPLVAPTSGPGDLIIMDFLTLHQSGFNVGHRPRWSMQVRYFNFREPTGIKLGWKPSVTAGSAIETLFPEYFV